jgi:hypothetical protein
MAPHPPALVAPAVHRTVRKRRDHAAQQGIGLNAAIGNTSDDRLYKKLVSTEERIAREIARQPGPGNANRI